MSINFKKVFVLLLCAAAFFYPAHVQASDSTAVATAKKKKKNVVLIAGAPSHGKGEHEYRGGCILLAKRLNENTRNINAVVYDVNWPEAAVLENADAIVLFCDGADGHMIIPHLAEMETLMKRGVGLVLLHYALELPKGEKGDYFLNWVGGYFERFWSVNPWWGPSFDSIPKHTVTRGVKPFSIKDEWYYHMRFADNMKGITPLLVTLPPKETLNQPEGSHSNNPFVRADIEKGIPQTMAWAFERTGGGRGFGFTGGHMHNNWRDDDFRKLVLNAIVWAAKEKVPKRGIISPTPTQAEMDSLLYDAK
jgi:type 1 glutamine amidotransferase